jgi:hypothetical protein
MARPFTQIALPTQRLNASDKWPRSATWGFPGDLEVLRESARSWSNGRQIQGLYSSRGTPGAAPLGSGVPREGDCAW